MKRVAFKMDGAPAKFGAATIRIDGSADFRSYRDSDWRLPRNFTMEAMVEVRA